ncbi:LVIVD repeat-containing protein [Haloarchaeobius amylolyticus]|uniref:LVIVD repeat-containing protein n=1 Tax=Haloarchaeobius amylolyticus TaxID=1198296 RepID=UPI00226E7B9F|nr:hypothetical protein [Haloarchaeobius amylolyticus]
MRRRDVLRAGVGALSLPLVGGAATARRDDTTHTTTPYEPLGSVTIDGAAEAVVNEDGTVAFLAVGDGFATVDIADPTSPSVLAERRGLSPEGSDQTLQTILDVKYADDLLVVPGPAQSGPIAGFFLYDVTDPASPERLSWYSMPFVLHNVDFDGSYVYATGLNGARNPLSIVDVTDPTDPQPGSRWSPIDYGHGWEDFESFQTLHDVTVQGDYAYCAYWDAGVFVLDVSDRTDPRFVGHVGDYTPEELQDLPQSAGLEPPGNAHYVAVNDDASIMAEGGESWDLQSDDGEGGPSGIELFDLSDPASPEKLATIEPPKTADASYSAGTWTTSHNFELTGDRLYSSWYQGGVMIHDISDPANPDRLVWWRDPDELAFWTARLAVDDEFFVASAYAVPGTNTSGLYTFPDRAGEQVDPSSLVVAPEDDLPTRTTTRTTTTSATTRTTTTSATTRTTTTSATTRTTTTAGDEQTPATTTTTAGDTGGSPDEAIPGFGPVATLVGMGVGAAGYLRRRRRRREQD